MTSLCTISQASSVWSLYDFWVNHSFISIIIFLIILRYVLRWFFGITKIRQAQDRYTELLEEHTNLLQRQNQLLEEHQSVLNRLGEKLL